MLVNKTNGLEYWMVKTFLDPSLLRIYWVLILLVSDRLRLGDYYNSGWDRLRLGDCYNSGWDTACQFDQYS